MCDLQRLAVDPTTKWRRTYALGGKSEMLAVVRQDHEAMPVRVDIITDMASEVGRPNQSGGVRTFLGAGQEEWQGRAHSPGGYDRTSPGPRTSPTGCVSFAKGEKAWEERQTSRGEPCTAVVRHGLTARRLVPTAGPQLLVRQVFGEY